MLVARNEGDREASVCFWKANIGKCSAPVEPSPVLEYNTAISLSGGSAMFQHEYPPGFWYKLAERLPFVVLFVLVGSAFFAGFNRSFWGVVICIINIIALLGFAAMYWKYRSEESDLDAGRHGRL